METINKYFNSTDEIFQFGKHQGETLSDVLEHDYTYFYWCLNEIQEFFISSDVVDEIQVLFPHIIIPNAFIFNIENDDCCAEEDENWREESDKQTYGKYRGSWAQDVEGYNDDDIDTIFDGDPNAYWNID